MTDLPQNENTDRMAAKKAEAPPSLSTRAHLERRDTARGRNSERKFWAAVVTVAAVVAAAMGLGAFGARYVIVNWRILNAARQELYNLEEQNREISAAVRGMQRFDPELRFINSNFVDPASPLPFIESLESLGRKNGVETELALVSGPDKTQNYMLSVTGKFGQTMSFFKNLEMLPFLFELQDSEMSVLGEKEKGGGAGAKSEPSVRLNAILKPFSP